MPMQGRTRKIAALALVIHAISWLATFNLYRIHRYRGRTSFHFFGMEVSPSTHVVIGTVVTAALAISFTVLCAVIVATTWTRLRQLRRGFCPSCGYDLRATPHRCPECGAVPKVAA